MADRVLAVVDPESQAAEQVAGLVAEGHRHHRVGPAVLPEHRESRQGPGRERRDRTPGDAPGVGHDAAEQLRARESAQAVAMEAPWLNPTSQTRDGSAP